MSTYENYTETSEYYDSGRVPVGADLIKKIVQHVATTRKIDVSRVKILDAGCGTGNYLKYLYDIGCRNITGLEINDGMFAKSQNKIKEHSMSDGITLKRGSVLKIPFDDNTFDLILANQMLHHVDNDDTRYNKDFSNIKAAISEFNRVLMYDSGILMINETRRKQLAAYWYYDFILSKSVNGKKGLLNLAPDSVWFQNVLNERGFKVDIFDISDDFVNPPSLINNPQNAKDAAWRALDSTWSLLTDDELNQVLSAIDDACKDDKKWNEYMKNKETIKHIYGKSTYYVGHKIEDSSKALQLKYSSKL